MNSSQMFLRPLVHDGYWWSHLMQNPSLLAHMSCENPSIIWDITKVNPSLLVGSFWICTMGLRKINYIWKNLIQLSYSLLGEGILNDHTKYTEYFTCNIRTWECFLLSERITKPEEFIQSLEKGTVMIIRQVYSVDCLHGREKGPFI